GHSNCCTLPPAPASRTRKTAVAYGSFQARGWDPTGQGLGHRKSICDNVMYVATWPTSRHVAQFGSPSPSSSSAPCPSSSRCRREREMPSRRAASERLPPAVSSMARAAARWISARGAGKGRGPAPAGGEGGGGGRRRRGGGGGGGGERGGRRVGAPTPARRARSGAAAPGCSRAGGGRARGAAPGV